MYGKGREEENQTVFHWGWPFPVSVFVPLSEVLHKAEGIFFFQRRWKKSCVRCHPYENGSATVGGTKGRPYWLQHLQKYGFVPGSAEDKCTDVDSVSQKLLSFFHRIICYSFTQKSLQKFKYYVLQ